MMKQIYENRMVGRPKKTWLFKVDEICRRNIWNMENRGV